MLVPWLTLNRSHLATDQCAKGAERKRRRLAGEELQESLKRSFEAYGGPLDTVNSFKYLGRFMTAGDDNWPEMSSNLRKACNIWTRMTRILVWEGGYPRISDFF